MSYNNELEVLPLKRIDSDLTDSILSLTEDETIDEESLERSIRDMKLLGSALQPFEIVKNGQNLEVSIHRDEESIFLPADETFNIKNYLIIGACVLGGAAVGGPVGAFLGAKMAIGTTALFATGSVAGGALGVTVGKKLL